ncbi:hypothetical protein [Burkholderia sp. BCC1644]|uniref:hypothetical protein n=1 Tax=Burkholderia sp. BCC1644 TaxID=2676293 RepID=UPI00158FD771|nr:hypothetical protein [Burkholderia sp. BCC1644]
MRKWVYKWMLIGLTALPTLASAQIILITGKTTSKVTASVTRANNLIVTDDKGGWFENGLKMQQLGGWETAYDVQARLRIDSTTGRFRVRMDQPLQIVNQAKPTLAFRNPTVSMGPEGAVLSQLSMEQGVEFRNPAAPDPNVDSRGYYALAISALPPAGDFKSTVGTYTGTLSLTFEPIIVKQ